MGKCYRKTILIDLDGVINEYKGNFDENFIPKIRAGADVFIKKLADKYEIKLFTTRNRLLAVKWLIDNNIDCYFSDITNVKEPAWLMIDDRCLNFKGDYYATYIEIEKFQAWFKK